MDHPIEDLIEEMAEKAGIYYEDIEEFIVNYISLHEDDILAQWRKKKEEDEYRKDHGGLA